MKRTLIMNNPPFLGTEQNPITPEENEAAQQEAYYWHCIAEFHAMLKVFGQRKIMEDLQKIKEQVDGVVEKPLIIIP
jgi:hypothetical protein